MNSHRFSPELLAAVTAHGRLDLCSGSELRVFPNHYPVGTEQERFQELASEFFCPLFEQASSVILQHTKASVDELRRAGIEVISSRRKEHSVRVDLIGSKDAAIRFMCEHDRIWGRRGAVRIVTGWNEELITRLLPCLCDPSFTVSLRRVYAKSFVEKAVAIAAESSSNLVVELLGYGLNTISFFADPVRRPELLNMASNSCRFTPRNR